MEPISSETVVATARDLFREAYEGPAEGGAWFTNAEPNSGIFGTIERLSAEQASRSVAEGPSIAAHVEHLRWSLAAVNDVIRGKPWQPDWTASWSIQRVDEAQWGELRQALRHEYELLLEGLDAAGPPSDPMQLKGLLAMAPHAAHHLGTIRQIARQVRV